MTGQIHDGGGTGILLALSDLLDILALQSGSQQISTEQRSEVHTIHPLYRSECSTAFYDVHQANCVCEELPALLAPC